MLKITDFGMGKTYGNPDKLFTPGVVTMWYRAPEILYGSKTYGPAIDIWAIGCIIGELMTRQVLFPARELHPISQLSIIFSKMGTPSKSDWENVESLPSFLEFQEAPPMPPKTIFTAASDDFIDLLYTFLALNPNKRTSAAKAKEHAFFVNKPLPTPIEELRIIKK